MVISTILPEWMNINLAWYRWMKQMQTPLLCLVPWEKIYNLPIRVGLRIYFLQKSNFFISGLWEMKKIAPSFWLAFNTSFVEWKNVVPSPARQRKSN